MSAANIFSTGAAPYAGLSPKQSMVEQGRQAISVVKFNSLCEYLGISQSLVLTAVGARLVGMELKAYRDQQEADFSRLAEDGVRGSVIKRGAIRGVRGKRADDNRLAIQALQAQGLPKMEIVRRLGLSRAPVDRYWVKL